MVGSSESWNFISCCTQSYLLPHTCQYSQTLLSVLPNTSVSTPKHFCQYSQILLSVLPNTSVSTPKYFCQYSQTLLSVLPNTSVSTPKYFCQYSQTLLSVLSNTSVSTPKQPVSIFSGFWPDFVWFFFCFVSRMHHQSIKTKKYQRAIFPSFILQEQCKNSHFQWYRRTTKLAHYDTRMIYFVYIC